MSAADDSGPLAILLAAGIGRRLGGNDLPKVLLPMGRETLLARHLRMLSEQGISRVSITVGHQAEAIRSEVERCGFAAAVRFVENPRYREGSIVSLSLQDRNLRCGRPIVLMDGDVLYDRRMIARLLAAPGEGVLLVDRNIEPGDEPVKICFRGETIVDFRKKPEKPHDWHGESVGFFRFSPGLAARLADRCAGLVAAGGAALEYEEAIRDLILERGGDFHAADVSDLPWTEIDFPEDVARARDVILPRLTA